MYTSEEDFLNHYDSSSFEKLSLTTDIILFSVSDKENQNYRKLKEKRFSILLVKRDTYPFKGKWCLPGGFMQIDETTDEAACRVLGTETNLHHIYMEQLYTFSEVKRDPRMRIVSTAYMALVDQNRLTESLAPNASWFTMTILEDDGMLQITFDNDLERFTVQLEKVLLEKTTDRYEYKVIQNDALAFDHSQVIAVGITRLKNKVEYTDIVFNMMPPFFPLGELQQVYELLLGKKLLDPAFRRMIADKVIKTDYIQKGEGHRPSVLYQYRGHH